MAAWNRIEKPETELYEVSTVQVALRIPALSSADETLLKGYCIAGREYVENVAGISILKQRWRYTLRQFPYDKKSNSHAIQLPRSSARDSGVKSVTSVDVFTYRDPQSGEEIDLDGLYQLDDDARPAAIHPPYGQTFPATQDIPNSVTIEFTAGAESPEDIPETLKLAVLFMIAHFWENREVVVMDMTPEKIPYALESLICQYRMWFRAPSGC